MPDEFLATILIADDEPLFLQTTATLLRKANYKCFCADNGKSALERLSHEQIDLIISDLNMPGNLKLELLREGRDNWPDIPLIVVTGAPSLPSAIESVRLGISDYLLKPIKYDDLLSSVRRALARREHNRMHPSATRDFTERGTFAGIVGESPPMRELYEIIAHVAATDANVLITGESGTGKEVVAKAIHRHSGRAKKAFQIIDCTAIPDTLFESTLFGHAKGSFTGAVKDHSGLLMHADGGTAFFDEIGELPIGLQSKLLRLIQEQVFTPVGKTDPVAIDTRFICATNRELDVEVSTGRFRRDLYYRLGVIHIELPPLRRRGHDILLLARHFLQQLNRARQPITDFSEDAQTFLLQYGWPGNVRELRNAVERGIAMARNDVIIPSDLPEAIRRSAPTSQHAPTHDAAAATLLETVQTAERNYLMELLREHSGNVARSAVKAGMSRQGLHKLLRKHNLDADDFRN